MSRLPQNTINALPDGDVEREVEFVRVAGVRLQVKWAEINATAGGDTTVVAAVGSKKLRVLGLDIVTDATVGIAWKSGGATTKRNAQTFAANGGLVRECIQGFYVETNAGDALVINLSGAANVRGALAYVEV